VAQAVACSVPDLRLGEEVAAAVVLGEGSSFSETDLQEALKDRLSWARMPKRILILDQIPKGPTGKIQRIGLAERLGLESVEKGRGVRSPEPVAGTEPVAGARGGSDGSQALARIQALWVEVLKLPAVDPDQTFLEAGGDSVSATILVLRVQEEFEVEVPLMAFFDAATARKQAALVQKLKAQA
jgi:acyl carrier protein